MSIVTVSTAAAEPGLPDALATAASLIATAALVNATLVNAAGAGTVSVTVSGTDISVQVPRDIGDEQTRAAVVACYASALCTPVRRNRSKHSPHTWIEARGAIAGHPVHVWTIADPTIEEQ